MTKTQTTDDSNLAPGWFDWRDAFRVEVNLVEQAEAAEGAA